MLHHLPRLASLALAALPALALVVSFDPKPAKPDPLRAPAAIIGATADALR